MSNSRIYVKKGNLNYKERKYIKAIQDALEKKGINLDKFHPATNFGELQKLYDEYTIDETHFEEVGSKAEGNKSEQNTEEKTSESTSDKEHDTDNGGGGEETEHDDTYSSDIDPLNREAPIVRDYVMDEGMQREGEKTNNTGQTNFNEPTTFGESFEMPKDENNGDKGKKGGGGSGNSKDKKDKDSKPDPVNPDFDSMDEKKKRKSTKKFAKTIVRAVCKLSEMGCIWWVTKDITDDKLIEYELQDTIDLKILLTLEDNQTATVKQWFKSQVKLADEAFKITQEDEDDLADSLYEVMLEKGIAPTPMQELIINAVTTIVIGLGVKAYAMGQQIQNVITQLKEIKMEQRNTQSQEYHEEEQTDHENPATRTDDTGAEGDATEGDNNNADTTSLATTS